MDRPFARVIVSEKAEKSLKAGQVRVYGEETLALDGSVDGGGIVDVYSKKGKYLGSGFYNEASKQRVRIVSKNPNDRFDGAFWRRRLQYAVDYRKSVMGDDFSCCRLIFGDADGFPGLTVDRFGDVLVAEVLSYGCERIKATLFDALDGILASLGETVSVIYERSDGAIRALEGMLPATGAFLDRRPDPTAPYETTIVENGIAYRVDYGAGQKTGFFLDQRDNRARVGTMSAGRDVLNVFSFSGGFSLYAARGGASSVCSLDADKHAIAACARHFELNSGHPNIRQCKHEGIVGDAFEVMHDLAKAKRRFGLVIVDPPSFAKSAAERDRALHSYARLAALADSLLKPGGTLVFASCSSRVSADDLFPVVLAHTHVRELARTGHAADHPALFPESHYLKCLYAEKLP